MSDRLPLYRLQQYALDTTVSPEIRVDAIHQLGRRYAEGLGCPSGRYGAVFQRRLAAAYVRGFIGGPEVAAGYRRGGNWNRPLQSAWYAGARDAVALKDLVQSNAVEPYLPKPAVKP